MRIEASRRRKKPSRRVPAAEVREQFQDGRVWARKAQVFKPDGGQHFYIHTDQRTGARKVMVEVTTVPEGEDLTCQLSTRPLWYIPPPGTIVYVGIPSGEIDHCPEIIGISDSGAADQDISEDLTLLVSEKPIVLKQGDVRLGGVDADQPLVKGNARKSDEDTFITQMMTGIDTLIAACSSAPLSALNTGFGQLKAALSAFKLTLQSHLSDVSKTK